MHERRMHSRLEVCVPEGDAVESHAIGRLLDAPELQERIVFLLHILTLPVKPMRFDMHSVRQEFPSDCCRMQEDDIDAY